MHIKILINLSFHAEVLWIVLNFYFSLTERWMIKWNDLKKIKIQTNKTALGHDHMMISLFISGDTLLFSDLQSCDQYQPDRIKYDVAHWQANGAFRHTIYVYTGCFYTLSQFWNLFGDFKLSVDHYTKINPICFHLLLQKKSFEISISMKLVSTINP